MAKWRDNLWWLRRSSMVRLTAVLSALFAVGFVIAIFAALTLGQRANDRRLDGTLETLAQSAPIAQSRGDSPARIMRPLDDLTGLPKPFERAVARGGGIVRLTDDLMRSDHWRALITQDPNGTPILVALPIEDTVDARELQAQILWATAAVVVALTLMIGVWAGIMAQRRLARINQTLAQLAAGDLSARSNPNRKRDDLDDIGHSLDQTAGEIERLVTQTRHLSASIAHDLRTPLARLRAQLEMLPEGEERASALEEAGRLSDIFDTIMRVARIEAGQGRDGFENVPLQDLATDLGEVFGPVIEDAGKTLDVSVNVASSIFADRGMVVQAVANLLQNAIVHGGDHITLFVDGAQLGVADNGAGVDPAQFNEILKPMVRLDAARSSTGSGLGLALVRAVADRHGARLELSQNMPQGLRVTLEFTKL